jgi:hypothetical protein
MFTPAPGTYATAQSVALSDATPGAAIYYTTDGSVPTTTSTRYDSLSPISVSATTTINAIAIASGYTQSAVASGTYAIEPAPPTVTPTATPIFTPTTGTYTSALWVTLSDATPGAAIYYTTDGSVPTTTSTRYDSLSPLWVSATTTINAIAIASGYTQSAVASGTYTIQPCPLGVVCDPTFDPLPGDHYTCYGSLPVFLSVDTVGAEIHYTLDGSTPSSSSAVVQSLRPPEYPPYGYVDVAQDFQGLGTTTTIKAIAMKSGLSDSNVVEGTYTVYLNPDLEWCDCQYDPQFPCR